LQHFSVATISFTLNIEAACFYETFVLYLYNKHQDCWKKTSVLRAWHIVMIPKVACRFSGTPATCLEAYNCKPQHEKFSVKITDYKAIFFSSITVMASFW
jgi:hypothetical protein